MLRLFLIASGISDAMKRGAFPGAAEALDKHSVKLAEGLQKRFSGQEAMAAPDAHAQQTAEILKLKAAKTDGLRGPDYGDWTGKAFEALPPEDFMAWLADPSRVPPGGESTVALARRASAFLIEVGKLSGEAIAVAPAPFIRCAALVVLKAQLDAAFDCGPLSVTTLTHDGRRWAFRGLEQA